MLNSSSRALLRILAVCVVSFVLLCGSSFTGAVKATNTPFTQKGTGILGWHATPYGGSFTEAKMKANTDWIAANFKQYGYEFIDIDGWVADGTRHNANGYVTYYKTWAHDYAYWANYVHSKGLKLGVYYNPTWVLKSIADDTSVKIVGTNIPIKNIVNTTDPTKSFQDWYMVDPSKTGAEQYIKGMVNYYKSVGADLLKVDFIRYFDDAYGAAATETFYRWMREAAGNDLILYYANQKNRNHAAAESQYADMIRASEDWRQDVWYHTSTRNRGQVKDNSWPPAYNIFDGLIWLSDLSGKGKVVLDGDFSIMSSAGTDAEKKTRIGLLAMAGSSISIGDNYQNIGNNSVYYTNTEILDLNKQGFVGKPLSRDVNNALSQIWKGQLPNGDWVVGLFNRENTAQTRSINFKNDLGLTGSYAVRDLWSHSGIGTMSSYSASIEPHGSRLIKITNSNTQAYTFEAQSLAATTSGPAASTVSDANASGGKYVQFASAPAVGDWAEFTVNVPAAGTYNIEFGYKTNNNRGMTRLYVDGTAQGNAVDEYLASQTFASANLGSVTFAAAGNHKFRFSVTGKNSGSSNYNITYDYIKLTM